MVCGLVAKSCLTPLTLWTEAWKDFLSMGFPRQEYWSGLLFSSLGDLPDPGIRLISSPFAGGFLTTESPKKPFCYNITQFRFINGSIILKFYLLEK